MLLRILLLVTLFLLATASAVNDNNDDNDRPLVSSAQGGSHRDDVVRSRRSAGQEKNSNQHQPYVTDDLTREQRTKRDASDDVPMSTLPKRGDWAKTNVQMWGKRHSRQLADVLRRDAGVKRSLWNKNNVRMWGKRSGDVDDYYVDYYEWLDRNHANLKRESSDMGQVQNSWTGKNAWERNNMRIWG